MSTEDRGIEGGILARGWVPLFAVLMKSWVVRVSFPEVANVMAPRWWGWWVGGWWEVPVGGWWGWWPVAGGWGWWPVGGWVGGGR